MNKINKAKREERVRLFMIEKNKFEGRNKHDDVVLDADDDYLIYLKNVNFKNGNLIEGRYLGELDSESALIAVQGARSVEMDGEKFTINGKEVKTAKMVVINNKTNVVIVIENN